MKRLLKRIYDRNLKYVYRIHSAFISAFMNPFIFWLINNKIINFIFVITKNPVRVTKFKNIDDAKGDILPENKTPVYIPNRWGQQQNTMVSFFSEKEVVVKKYCNCMVFYRSSLLIQDKRELLLEYNYTNTPDLKFHDLYISGVINNNVFYKKSRKKVIHVKNGISLLGKGSWNYFHMLLEYLPKLFFITEDISNYTLIVDDVYKEYDAFNILVKELFKGKVLFTSNEDVVIVEDLIYVTTPFYLTFNKGSVFDASDLRYNSRINDWVRKLNHILQEKIKDNPTDMKKFEKIFLTRQNKVRTYNKTEIEEVAIKKGYEIIDFSKQTLLEQYLIMRNAKIFIGPTGASLTNLIFCRKETVGVTWMHKRWGDAPTFSTLAKICDVNLLYLDVESDSIKYHGEYILDVDYFSTSIDLIEIKYNIKSEA